MKYLKKILLAACLLLTVLTAFPQDQQARIDSLVTLLRSAGREWNDYAKPLIAVGEPAVPALIEVAQNQRLEPWNRRVAIMTLNDIHSPQWVRPALGILLDRQEDPMLRNQVTAGIKGADLSDVREELWQVYEEFTNEFQKMNIAGLLMDADTAAAYRAFHELYHRCDGYVQKVSLLSLVHLRPAESTQWFLDGLRNDDWMTAGLAMDSLVTSRYFTADPLLSLYHEPGIPEEVQWRIVYVLGHRPEAESVPLLLEAFEAESWLVHTEAAVGLSRFSSEQVIPEMKKLRKGPRGYVRNNARWVIRRMEGKDR